jgi:hypothetical protein
MRTSQTPPPHSVYKSQSDVAHQEHGEGNDCGVAVYYEDEIVYVDHLLGVPRACVILLRRVQFTDIPLHRCYLTLDSINLP